MHSKKNLLIIIFVLLRGRIASAASGGCASGDNVDNGGDFGGYISLQGEIENTDNMGVDAVGELTYKTRRIYKTRAVFTVEGKYYRRTLVVEDFYLDHKFNKQLKLTAGISKKILGLEYEHGRKDRATIHRGPIYQKMEDLGIVGRQFNLRLIGLPQKDDDDFKLSGAIGIDGSRDFNLQLSLQKSLGIFGVGVWVLAEARKVGSYYAPLYAQTASLWIGQGGARATLETFTGIDTQRTEFYSTFGEDRTVLFGGASFKLTHEYRVNNKFRLGPVFHASYWIDDLEKRDNNSLELLIGGRFSVRRIGVSLNGTVTGNAREGLEKRSFDDKECYAEVIFYF